MVGLMMENQSEECTKPSAATHDGSLQGEAVATPEEIFKKPLSPSKSQAHSMQPGAGDDDAVFKKPSFPSKVKKLAVKVEEEDDDNDGEAVFKKPAFPSRPSKQFVKSEEGDDAVFKKPISMNKTTTKASRMNEEEDVVFKKPVFISRAQRQATKAEGQQDEEGSSSSDQPASQSFKSPAQSLSEKSATIPYKEPNWSGVPQGVYSFEVLKGGVIMETLPLNRPFVIIGRQSQCDIVLEHPSLSRFHCVIQYRAVEEEGATAGFYAYDLGSTHGSFHNKHQMKPHTYYRLHVGHMLKLAGSTRSLILQGPEEDQEPESDLSVTELMKLAEERKKKLEHLETGEEDEEEEEEEGRKKSVKESNECTKESEDSGINWGMREDAEEEEEEEEEENDDGRKNPFASSSDNLHLDDPKKTLRGWFERHGYDPPSYTIEETGPGCCRCSVELPVESKAPVVVSVDHRGKRKEAVVQCAMEACRTLDRRNLLRQAKHEGHHQRKRDWADNDYYDSDEDDFLDRTGDIQRRRLKRMKASGSTGQEGGAETYDSLMKKYRQTTQELAELEDKLVEAEAIKKAGKTQREGEGAEDDLDSFMMSLKAQAPDKHKRVTWKLRAIELRKEELKLRRLINIARPLGIPELKPYQSLQGIGTERSSFSRKAGLAGIGGRLKGLPAFPTTTTTPSQPKEPEYRVHKIFQEEEPINKVKLRRLDDDSEDVKPVVPALRPPKVRETVKASHTKQILSIPRHSTLTVPSGQPMKNEAQTHSAKQVMEKERSDIPVQKVAKEACEEPLPDKEKAPSQVSSETIEDKALKKGEDENQESSTSGESQPERKARVLGPTLPPHLAHLKTTTQCPVQPRKKEKKRKKYDEDDPNYVTWMPPSQQSGDGRTALNDKLGY